MDWYDKKTRRNVFRIASLVVLLIAVCLMYVWYRKENLSEYQRQDAYLRPKSVDSAASPDMRIVVEREIDSIKKASGGDTPSSFYVHVNPQPKPADSLASAPAALPRKSRVDSNYVTDEKTDALHGPFALFSHTYTIAIGKTAPVTILWTDGGAKTETLRLVTIKVEDIAGKKARFTIEDPFNVLLFSQMGYGVNDKIMIKDEKHDIDISVLEVKANLVVIKLVSHLNEGIIGKLQKVG